MRWFSRLTLPELTRVAPQRFGDVFHAAHAHARQIHLHERFFNRRFPPPVPLDDRRLER